MEAIIKRLLMHSLHKFHEFLLIGSKFIHNFAEGQVPKSSVNDVQWWRGYPLTSESERGCQHFLLFLATPSIHFVEAHLMSNLKPPALTALPYHIQASRSHLEL
jgi:hypothetical protein